MEADRSVGGGRKRQPLADCTNTVSRSSLSSSSSATVIKSVNPCLTSSLKRIIDDTRIKERSRVGDKSHVGTRSVSRRQVAGVTNPSSADPVSPATAPSRSRNSLSDRGVGNNETIEPHSVYTRRKASAKRKKKNKEEAVSEQMHCLLRDTILGSGEKTHQADINVSKPLRAPREKRQRRGKLNQDGSSHTLPKAFIEQQRAYFAEIDAFELPEEEVTSTDDLE